MTGLPLPPVPANSHRAALLAHWIRLTGTVLPDMAREHGWPIRLDHCFMRVCLDTSLGARWDTLVRRPAIWHLDLSQLAAAVAQAERVAAEPSLLPALNQASLALRRKRRRLLPHRPPV